MSKTILFTMAESEFHIQHLQHQACFHRRSQVFFLLRCFLYNEANLDTTLSNVTDNDWLFSTRDAKSGRKSLWICFSVLDGVKFSWRGGRKNLWKFDYESYACCWSDDFWLGTKTTGESWGKSWGKRCHALKRRCGSIWQDFHQTPWRNSRD